MKPVPVRVIHNLRLSAKICRLGLLPLEPLPHAAAGRFYMVRVAPGLDPLLRRPLGHYGYCRAPESAGPPAGMALELLYQIKGRGTDALSRLLPGAETDLIGPLGHGWKPAPAAKSLLLLAGGIGIVPLRGLADQLRAAGDTRPISLIWGACTQAEICCSSDLEALGLTVRYATDDGSLGHPGFATDLLEPALAQLPGPATVFACGPRPLLQKAAAFCRERRLAGQLSLDEFMACGLGACLSCVVPGSDGQNLRVCKEGPVFDAGDLRWEEA